MLSYVDEDDLPPLTGNALLDPWRRRLRQQRAGLIPRQVGTLPEETRSEVALWEVLRREPEQWIREYATGPYRLDFYCPAVKLAVEVDGSSHAWWAAWKRDAARDDYHRALGITTKRFSADEVERAREMVLAEIRQLTRQTGAAALGEPESTTSGLLVAEDALAAPLIAPARRGRRVPAPAAAHLRSSMAGSCRRRVLKVLSLLLRFGPAAFVMAVAFNIGGIQQPVGHFGNRVIVDPVVHQFQDSVEENARCVQARGEVAAAQRQVAATATQKPPSTPTSRAAAKREVAQKMAATPKCFSSEQLAQARAVLTTQ